MESASELFKEINQLETKLNSELKSVEHPQSILNARIEYQILASEFEIFILIYFYGYIIVVIKNVVLIFIITIVVVKNLISVNFLCWHLEEKKLL